VLAPSGAVIGISALAFFVGTILIGPVLAIVGLR
jgi:hypothetical protein